jgi:hypothetical protein
MPRSSDHLAEMARQLEQLVSEVRALREAIERQG